MLALGGLVGVVFVQMIAGFLAVAGVRRLWSWLGLVPLVYRNRAGRNGWQIFIANAAWAFGRSPPAEPLRLRHRRAARVRLAPAARTARSLHAGGGARMPTASRSRWSALPDVGHYTVVLNCDPEGSQLVDQDVLDTWVAYQGSGSPTSATRPTSSPPPSRSRPAPDPGTRLANEVERLLARDAPDLSRAVLEEAARTYPLAGARVSARVALTFTRADLSSRSGSGFGGKQKTKTPRVLRSAEEMALDLGQRLPGSDAPTDAHRRRGHRAMTAAELAETVRIAFDPAVGESIESLREAGEETHVTWECGRPGRAVESWGSYRHDSAASVTFQMVQAPKGAVQCRVLERAAGAELRR